MSTDSFAVSLGDHLMSGVVHHARPLWRGLGRMESWLVREQIARTPITQPIYVTGLARSGTTILLEILASHPQVATHQYRDFPFLFIPYWWRQTLERSAPAPLAAKERAHGDRLMVSAQSPEAMEEVLWMSFFKQLHNPTLSNVLNSLVSHPAFERFYRDHISKLLLITGRQRYAAKGNYNLTRLEYLLKLFPDARFVLPIRRPREQIASLMKQHRLFSEAARAHPRSVAHLDRVGHFEFGVHRRCINPGDTPAIESIEALWREGQEVRGWARYWATLYRWVAARLAASDALRRATLIVRYEQLCDQPEEMLEGLLDHLNLPDAAGELRRRWSPSLKRPEYYQSRFTSDEQRAIDEETAHVAGEMGCV
ncbi:MAG TPA: sulfotransferase [Tepidisphaeraceae bacterium]|jgi:hypothetical protein